MRQRVRAQAVGGNPNVKREAWDELMDRMESGKSGGVIIFDLERFTRQPKDGERMIDLAARGLLVLDSESEYDLTTPNGKKAFRDAINAAAYYSDRLSTRVPLPYGFLLTSCSASS